MVKKTRLFFLLSAMCLAVAACGRITITARTNGVTSGSTVDAVELALTRGDLESVEGPRVRSFAGRNEAEILRDPSAQLRVDVTGNPADLAEAYHFTQILTDEGLLSGGTSDNRDFVVNHIGRSFHLTRRQGQPPQETILNGRVHLGSALLAIVQDNDRVIPWRIEPGDPACFPPMASDCFDIETLTRQLFANIADEVDGTVPDRIPFSSVVIHRLHFVPRVLHTGFEAEGRRARGFGLIYYVMIEVPTVTFEVYVPISILFLDDITDYRIAIDPVGFGSLAPGPENLDRIFVKGTFIGALAEGAVRDAVADAIASADLPEIIPGVDFDQVLLLGFNSVAGSPPTSGQPPRISTDYEAILLPEGDETNLNTTILWERVRGGSEEEKHPVRLVFLE